METLSSQGDRLWLHFASDIDIHAAPRFLEDVIYCLLVGPGPGTWRSRRPFSATAERSRQAAALYRGGTALCPLSVEIGPVPGAASPSNAILQMVENPEDLAAPSLADPG